MPLAVNCGCSMKSVRHEDKLMPKAYEFFEHTADLGANIYGATLEELFCNAAKALYEAMGSLQKTDDRREKTVELRAESLEDLLHDWLAELLYEVEAKHVLYDEFEIVQLKPPLLVATLHGSSIDFARSQTNQEIKAVTYHQLCVEALPDGTWRARIILDV
jgi:SHS2 domain-containing protein